MDRNPAEVLVDHALALRWANIPAAARVAATTFLQDTLAVGVAGRHAAHADGVLAMVTGWGAGSQASVLGRPGLRLPAHAAAGAGSLCRTAGRRNGGAGG